MMAIGTRHKPFVTEVYRTNARFIEYSNHIYIET